MRRLLLFPLLAALAGPALAQGDQVFQFQTEIPLRHLTAAQLRDLLPGAPPPGVAGGRLSARDNTLHVMGSQAAQAAVRSAVEVIDRPVEAGSLTLTLRQADPEAARAAMLALPGAGRVAAEERRLRLQGPARWLEAARGVALHAELGLPFHPREVPVQPPPIAPDDLVLNLPPGTTFTVEAPDAEVDELDPRAPPAELLGPARIRFSNGMELQGEDLRLEIEERAAHGGPRVSLRLLPERSEWPAAAPDLESIPLRHLSAAEALAAVGPVDRLPPELYGLRLRAGDGQLLARGRPEARETLRAAIQAADAPIRDGRLEVTVGREATVSLLRLALLAVRGAGEVTVEGPRLRLEGPREWLETARGMALRHELGLGPLFRPRAEPEESLAITFPRELRHEVEHRYLPPREFREHLIQLWMTDPHGARVRLSDGTEVRVGELRSEVRRPHREVGPRLTVRFDR